MIWRRSGILWGVFGLAVVLAMWGWLWVVQRLLESEAELTAAQVKGLEEEYLHVLAPIVEKSIRQVAEVALTVPRSEREGMIRTDAFHDWREGSVIRSSGMWFAQEDMDGPVDEQVVSLWRQRVRDGGVTPAELRQAFRDGDLEMGWVEDGRDVVAGLVLSMLERDPGDAILLELLFDRVWEYEGTPLRPAFRLLMIRKLLESRPSEELMRLKVREELRLEWENTGAVEGHDIVRAEKNGEVVVTFWTKEQLESIAGQHSGGATAVLREKEWPGMAGLRIEGPERWNVLGLQGHSYRPIEPVEANQSAMIWLGATGGLLVLGLAIGAALLARKELRLGRMRTDLAASVAHELRTPLAGQRLLLESLVERSGMPEEEREDYVKMSLRENLRLGRLAEEFLTFSRLERGVLSLEEELVAPAQVVDEAVESLQEKWSASACRLTVEVPDDLSPVTADEQALVTVVRNLLENAWKYSGDEKEISVTAGEEGDEVWIAVRDNGIGVAPADQERVFRQFYRVDQCLSREKDGLGIGLSIVRRLMLAMRGRVELESEVGEGSEFKLRLPKMP